MFMMTPRPPTINQQYQVVAYILKIVLPLVVVLENIFTLEVTTYNDTKLILDEDRHLPMVTK